MFKNSRLILPVWQRFLVLIILFTVTLALWLTRVRWVPLFSHYLVSIEQQANTLGAISSVIGISGAIINVVILLLVILTGTRLFLDDREELAIITAVTIDDLQAQLGSGGRIKWIDRGVVNSRDLAKSRRVLIVGHANQGKSREAIELARASVEETDMVPFNRIYEPAPPLFLRNPASLRYPIQQLLDLHSSLLVILDDLPERFPPGSLGLASTLLAELDAKTSLFVIATADESQIDHDYRKWLTKEEGFQIVELRGFNSGELAELAYLASQYVGINLTQEGIDHIASLIDVNPRQVLTALHLLARLGQAHPTIAQISAVMPQAQTETWEIERNILFRRMPSARYLLEAMSAFSALDLTSFASIVIPFASQLWAQQQKSPSNPWKRERILKQTLMGLSSYGVSIHSLGIKSPDHMLEPKIPSAHYLGSLKTYLLARARVYRLRIVPPERGRTSELLLCMLQLGRYYLHEPDGHGTAENLFRSALQITGNRSVGSYVLLNLARLHIPSTESMGGKHVSSHDIEWPLLALRGYSLALGEKYTESLASLDKALETAGNSQDAAQHIPNLLMIRGMVHGNSGDIALALSDLDQAIALDPTDPTLFRLRAEAHHELGNSIQALSDISKALELEPNYWEALLWRAFLQMQRPDLRASISAITGVQEVCGSQDCSNELMQTLHVIKGALFEQLGEPENARAEYSAAIASTENYSYYMLRGFVNVQLLDYDAALSDFEHVRELAPDAHARNLLPGEGLEFDVFFVSQSSRVARAASAHMGPTKLVELLRAIETSPNDPALLYALSMRFFKKDADLSLHFIDRAINVAQDDHTLYGFRASLALMSGNIQQALADYRVAVDLSPHSKIADYYLNQITIVDLVGKELIGSFIANELPGNVKKAQENVPPKSPGNSKRQI